MGVGKEIDEIKLNNDTFWHFVHFLKSFKDFLSDKSSNQDSNKITLNVLGCSANGKLMLLLQ